MENFTLTTSFDSYWWLLNETFYLKSIPEKSEENSLRKNKYSKKVKVFCWFEDKKIFEVFLIRMKRKY